MSESISKILSEGAREDRKLFIEEKMAGHANNVFQRRSALRLEALRYGVDVCGSAHHDDAVLAAAEKFYQFLISDAPATPKKEEHV